MDGSSNPTVVLRYGIEQNHRDKVGLVKTSVCSDKESVSIMQIVSCGRRAGRRRGFDCGGARQTSKICEEIGEK